MSAATTALRDQATQAKALVEGVQSDFADEVQALHDAIDGLMALDDPSDLPAVTTAVADILDAVAGFVTQLGDTVRTTPLPAAVKAGSSASSTRSRRCSRRPRSPTRSRRSSTS